MKKRFVTILQYLFFLGLGIFFVWLTVKDIHHAQWLQIKDAISRARHWMIIPALLLLFVAHYSRALRWKILMEPMGYHPSTFNVFAAVMIGYLVNAGVPRLGEVVKCSMLARYEKVRVDRLVGTIVMERAVDVICLLIVFACALIFEGRIINEHIFSNFTSFFQDRTGHISIQKVFLLLGGLAVFLVIVYYLLKRFSHIDVVAKIKTILIGILHGLGSIRLIKHKGWFLFHSIFIWGLYLAATTVGIYALQETSRLGIGGGLTTLALGSIGMIIAPGGIGAYAWIVAKLVGWYGLDETTIGTALGWLLWSVQTLIILLGGLIFFALLSYHNKKRNTSETRQQHPAETI
ncbi:MAG TPA: lysylphosphatidylglycerol synthase transmembrane domain-containing protein [Niastella sp.]|nr:lysylphosphatidylglycerol synthase transmembrane domain-containing protein [Niastella sp.]